MITWLLVPENEALLTWIAFGLGLLGLALGAWGIWVALKQLAAIKSETEASNAAIRQVQIKVASFDTVQECNHARALIGQIKEHLHAESWSEVLRGYEQLIESFLRLAHSNSLIAEDDRSALTKHTKDMARFCEGIRKKLPEAEKGMVLRGQDMALRDFSDAMTKVTFSVMKELQK